MAYAAQTFTLNDPGTQPNDAAHRLRAFGDGYNADSSLRRTLPGVMWKRAQAMHGMLSAAHDNGREPWGTMFSSGHGRHWEQVTEYVKTHEAIWANSLLSL